VGSTEIWMRFEKPGSVSDANGNVLLADPSHFWADPDPVPKCGSADLASRGAGSGNIVIDRDLVGRHELDSKDVA
jgi:hypothetical protein